MFYLFSDYNCGCKAIFDNKEALDKFVKDYGISTYDFDNTFPIRNQDYSIAILTIINPDFKTWNEEGYYYEDDDYGEDENE